MALGGLKVTWMSLMKPQLRGLLSTRLKREFMVAFALGMSALFGTKFFLNDPRKQAYADYYAHYDVKTDYAQMVKAGVFQSVKPDGTINTDAW